MTDPHPTDIRLRTRSRVLEITFDDGERHELPFEYLRVYSPSADVRGHGAGEGKLELAKENVQVTAVEPIGNYAVRLDFDDGHNTGLYTQFPVNGGMGLPRGKRFAGRGDRQCRGGQRKRPARPPSRHHQPAAL